MRTAVIYLNEMGIWIVAFVQGIEVKMNARYPNCTLAIEAIESWIADEILPG